MNVLGYSGLHNGVAFKASRFPELDARLLRVSQGLDSAGAIVCDGATVAAAAEERFTGAKGTNVFPQQAAKFCLAQAGLRARDLDAVAHAFDHRSSTLHEQNSYTHDRFEQVYRPECQLEWLEMLDDGVDWAAKLVPVRHHLAHAASAFYPSGFEEALVLVADGMGETESLSVAWADQSGIRVLHTVSVLHSLGVLYGVGTLYLGFDMNMDEYKVMGLAGRGDRRSMRSVFKSFVELRESGTFTVPLLGADVTLYEKETHEGVIRVLEDRCGPRRQPHSEFDQRHADFAAALQDTLETCLLHVLGHYREVVDARRVVMAGGVALNCSANGVVARSRLFDDIFVQPAAGDDGSSLGAALIVDRQLGRDRPAGSQKMNMPFWGPSHGPDEIDAAMAGLPPELFRKSYASPEDLCEDVADVLARQRTVALFQGRMEFGPRALGNRSILADPRDYGMRDHLNRIVKGREDFRPFAPVVTREAAAEYFDVDPQCFERYRHMLFAVPVRSAAMDLIPAVVHVDGTARVQIVDRDGNPFVWRLLTVFRARTGLPVLINTSFNLRGQPIVCGPDTAVETFLRSALDHLVLDTHLIGKESSLP